MAKFSIISIFCALYVAQTHGLIWKDCGSAQGTVKSIHVPGCESTPTCQLPKGTNVTISVEFVPKEDVTKATAVVHGVIAGIPIPFPIDNPDGCTKSGLNCPLKSGSDNTYSATLSVKTSYPSVRVTVEWELRDQNSKDIFCVKLPAQITSAKTDNKLYFKPQH